MISNDICVQKDQGWGNRKGMLYLQLIRGEVVLHTVPLHNDVAQHEWSDVELTVRTS